MSDEFTRQQSADLFERVVGHIECRAPQSTADIAAMTPEVYLGQWVDMPHMHQDHYTELLAMLKGVDPETGETALEKINRHAAEMRSFMTGSARVPWYDEG